MSTDRKRVRAIGSSENASPGTLRYCPFCGHALAEDMTAQRKFGVQVVLCPAERLRIKYSQFSGTLVWEKVA